MKKKIILISLIALLMYPLNNINALSKKDYTSKDLEATLTEENIEHDLSNYKDNNKKITIYMFRGNGCGYCKQFLTFLNSIVDEYGQYFKLESYEVWSNKKNQELLDKVSAALEVNVSGVPFIIIGDKTFSGYSSRYDEQIKSSIKDLYESKEKFDVFEEIERKEKEADRANKPTNRTVVLLNLAMIFFATATIIIVNNKNANIINAKIEMVEKKLNEIKKAEEKENEKESKINERKVSKPNEKKVSKTNNDKNKRK